MGLILDTCLLIANERGKFDLAAFLFSHGDELVAISSITLSELLHGVHRAANSKIKGERSRFIASIREDYRIIPFGESQAEQHARIWAELERSGLMTGAHDLLIAATALSVGYSLVTFNKNDFHRIPDLIVIEPLPPTG
jgi:tRNA(fMet)-specific endonuclease VapC